MGGSTNQILVVDGKAHVSSRSRSWIWLNIITVLNNDRYRQTTKKYVVLLTNNLVLVKLFENMIENLKRVEKMNSINSKTNNIENKSRTHFKQKKKASYF